MRWAALLAEPTGKSGWFDKPMPKAAALGVVRGSRGKDEPLKLVVPAIDPKEPSAKRSKPFAHPRYWAAFILIGDPD